MAVQEKKIDLRSSRLPGWLTAVLPLLALALLVLIFTLTNPLALFRSSVPPLETLSIQRIRVLPEGFKLTVVNAGSVPATIAQVTVDDAYWQYEITPRSTLQRLGKAEITIPYKWVAGEPHFIQVITSIGTTFIGEVTAATPTPVPGAREFAAYGLVGIYVGIIPVGLGLMWYPALKRMGRRWLGFLLALTVGLLVFLLIDTLLEALEVAADLPGIFQGVPLALFSALVTWLAIMALGGRRKKAAGEDARSRALYVAVLIAAGIGLHNFGEGLVVGAAFALGEAALGSFLVIGFILHNITEGIGIAAPLVPSKPVDASQQSSAARIPPGNICRAGGAGRSAGRARHLAGWVCLLAPAGNHFPGHRPGRHLAGGRRGDGFAAPLRRARRPALGLLAQPGRVYARPGGDVLYGIPGEVMQRVRPKQRYSTASALTI